MEVEEAPAQLMLEGQQAQQHGPLSFRGVPQQRWPESARQQVFAPSSSPAVASLFVMMKHKYLEIRLASSHSLNVNRIRLSLALSSVSSYDRVNCIKARSTTSTTNLLPSTHFKYSMMTTQPDFERVTALVAQLDNHVSALRGMAELESTDEIARMIQRQLASLTIARTERELESVTDELKTLKSRLEADFQRDWTQALASLEDEQNNVKAAEERVKENERRNEEEKKRLEEEKARLEEGKRKTEEDLTQRQAQLKDGEEKLASRQAEIHQASIDLANRQGRAELALADRQTAAARAETVVADRQTSVARFERDIANRWTAVAEAETNIANRWTAIAQAEAELANRQTAMNEGEVDLAQLQTTMATSSATDGSDKVDRLTQSLSELKTKVTDMTATVSDQGSRFMNQLGQVSEKLGRFLRSAGDAEELTQQVLAAVQDSNNGQTEALTALKEKMDGLAVEVETTKQAVAGASGRAGSSTGGTHGLALRSSGSQRSLLQHGKRPSDASLTGSATASKRRRSTHRTRDDDEDPEPGQASPTGSPLAQSRAASPPVPTEQQPRRSTAQQPSSAPADETSVDETSATSSQVVRPLVTPALPSGIETPHADVMVIWNQIDFSHDTWTERELRLLLTYLGQWRNKGNAKYKSLNAFDHCAKQKSPQCVRSYCQKVRQAFGSSESGEFACQNCSGKALCLRVSYTTPDPPAYDPHSTTKRWRLEKRPFPE
ncbi:MAG: hypothetical protein Q9211_005547 [Gyalolechia sp. 1 TL-2023]